MLSMWGKSAGESEIFGWERRLAGAQADSERENHVSLAPQHSHEALGLVFSQALDYAGDPLLLSSSTRPSSLSSLLSSLLALSPCMTLAGSLGELLACVLIPPLCLPYTRPAQSRKETSSVSVSLPDPVCVSLSPNHLA